MAEEEHKQSYVEQEALLFGAFLFLALVGVLVWFVHGRLYITSQQVIEVTIYCMLATLYCFQIALYYMRRDEKLAEMWPKPRIRILPDEDAKYLQEAAAQDSVLLGYDEAGKPFFWKNEIRSMQSIAIGSTGAGKTELLKGIFQQDAARGGPVIFIDGKGEKKVVNQLLAYINFIGRTDDVRVLDPTHSESSVRYNPFSAPSDRIDQHVSFVFDSFNRGKSSDSFFDEHQRTYLENIARVLYHTGRRFNFYDVLVAAYDVKVLQSLMMVARDRVRRPGIATKQQALTLEMSIFNLINTFNEPDRISKIQGLINNMMSFMGEDLALITGPYDNLLSLDDVIDKNLILIVSLNTNVESKSTIALGRILLQNLQLMIGKRYAEYTSGKVYPFVSVFMDEFAPFAYANFATIINQARGANVGFLTSMQNLPQLAEVSQSFQDNVGSSANTKFILRTSEEKTVQNFLNESAKFKTFRRSMKIETAGMFNSGIKVGDTGTQSEIVDTRAQDFHIKTMPTGQMEFLMSDHKAGKIHQYLHVRRALNYFTDASPVGLYPALKTPKWESNGLNLRFSEPNLESSRLDRGRNRRRGGI
jgi:hypothetical protein